MPNEQNLPNLVINEVESSKVFKWMEENNKINDHELYLVTDPKASALRLWVRFRSFRRMLCQKIRILKIFL